MQHSQMRRRGQDKYQKFNVGHGNIPVLGLISSSQTSQIAQETVLNHGQNPNQKVTETAETKTDVGHLSEFY